MDTSKHTLQALFFQLGLADEEESIHDFIERHRHLPHDITLPKAEFWTDAQAAFLTEAIKEDSDWCALVDELDCYLREKYSWISVRN